MIRTPCATLIIVALAALGCVSQGTWTPTVDTYGSSRAQYLSSDLSECRALARSSSGDTAGETAKGAAIGGLIGAAAGAAIGAAAGSPGTGAAVGAAAGGFGGGAIAGGQSQKNFKQAYRNCMRNRGHKVID
jgi:outer membrane lipoprotein SlyB